MSNSITVTNTGVDYKFVVTRAYNDVTYKVKLACRPNKRGCKLKYSAVVGTCLMDQDVLYLDDEPKNIEEARDIVRKYACKEEA